MKALLTLTDMWADTDMKACHIDAHACGVCVPGVLCLEHDALASVASLMCGGALQAPLKHPGSPVPRAPCVEKHIP